MADERFALTCDLGGMAAWMVRMVEFVTDTGVVKGPEPGSPIRGVIATGGYILCTAGEAVGLNSRHIFTGQGSFAEMAGPSNGRFRCIGRRMTTRPGCGCS